MSAWRFFVIIVIFVAVSVAWMVLGASVQIRTSTSESNLSKDMDRLWGPSDMVQVAPVLVPAQSGKATESAYVDPLASEVTADFTHEYRDKGLLWFTLYTVDFAGTYTFESPLDAGPAGTASVILPLPKGARFFENLKVELDGEPQEVVYSTRTDNALEIAVPSDGQPHKVAMAMKTRGRDQWSYSTAWPSQHTSVIRNFTLTATTDFKDINYPGGTVSPTAKAEPFGEGVKAVWHYEDVRADLSMGVEVPARIQGGVIAARMSYFAPVSLFFFLTVLFTIVLLKKLPLHPMHYLFISAGFFAFHILMAYLADVMAIHAVFWLCAAVSVLLVVTYLGLVAGVKFAVVYAGLAQLVYLIGFSYAFFWTGWTGRAVVIGAIVTLFVLMQATGRVNWNEVFRKSEHEPWVPVGNTAAGPDGRGPGGPLPTAKGAE